jgi:hypothetical protein
LPPNDTAHPVTPRNIISLAVVCPNNILCDFRQDINKHERDIMTFIFDSYRAEVLATVE